MQPQTSLPQTREKIEAAYVRQGDSEALNHRVATVSILQGYGYNGSDRCFNSLFRYTHTSSGKFIVRNHETL